MKAIQKVEKQKGAALMDVPVPKTGDKDLLVKVKAAALCKSDVDVYDWTNLVQASNLPLPFTMGHEFSGEVIEAGSAVDNFSVGDHIAGETHIPCGYCHTCRTGNAHICENMGLFGRTVDGCFAEYIRIPAVSAIKIDKGIPFAHGALMEPLGVALHAVTKAGVSGKTVAVMGCGVIGVMAVEFAKILGAVKVIGVSTSRSKLDEALKHGADLVVNNKEGGMVKAIMEATDGKGVDVVIEMTGNEKVINDSMEILKVAGKCVFVGTVVGKLTFDKFMKNVVYKELNLTGIFGREMYQTWELLAQIIAAGRLNLKEYVCAELPLDRFDEAMELFPSAIGRIVLYP